MEPKSAKQKNPFRFRASVSIQTRSDFLVRLIQPHIDNFNTYYLTHKEREEAIMDLAWVASRLNNLEKRYGQMKLTFLLSNEPGPDDVGRSETRPIELITVDTDLTIYKIEPLRVIPHDEI